MHSQVVREKSDWENWEREECKCGANGWLATEMRAHSTMERVIDEMEDLIEVEQRKYREKTNVWKEVRGRSRKRRLLVMEETERK